MLPAQDRRVRARAEIGTAADKETGARQGIQAAQPVRDLPRLQELVRGALAAVRVRQQVKTQDPVAKAVAAETGAEMAAALLIFSRCSTECPRLQSAI